MGRPRTTTKEDRLCYQREWERRRHNRQPQDRPTAFEYATILGLLAEGIRGREVARLTGWSQSLVSLIKRGKHKR